MVSSPGQMQATFTSGELDVMLIDRTQLKYFSSGAKRMENVHIHPQGGFSVAGRMRHLSIVNDASERMISFVNSEGSSFDLVIAAGLISVWRDGAHFQDLQLPHSVQQIRELNHVQSLDTLLLFHRNVPTRRIRQLADDDWRIEELIYENTPTWDYGAEYTNNKPAVWELEFVGLEADTVIQLRVSGQETRSMTYTSEVAIVSEIQAAVLELSTVRDGIKVSSAGANKVSIKFSGEGNEGDGWAVSGTVINKADAAIVAYKTTVGVSPGEDIISKYRGWPGCGAFIQQRLMSGGLAKLPNVWMVSVSGDYYNFDEDQDEANGAFVVPMDVPGGERIERIVEGRNVLVFTSEGEYWLSDREISKKKPPIHVKSSSHGCAAGVPIVENEGAAIFVHKDRGVISEFRYTDVDGNFVALPISLLAAHMFENIKDIALRKQRYSSDANLLAVVEDDGDLRFGHLLREQDVTAFTRIIGPRYKAVSCNGRNELVAIVEREAGGQARCALERFEPGLILDGAIDMQSAQPISVVDGLDIHEGAEVWAIADGDVFGPFMVENKAITLPVEALEITVGQWTPPVVETLPPPRDIGPGVVLMRPARIHTVRISVVDTTSLAVSVCGKVYDVPLHRFGSQVDVPELEQGFTGVIPLQGFTGYFDEPTVTITQVRPGRLTVRSITIEADL
ncbi:hypothetical protein [Pseudovibrio sp. POLY-S9]|uniref:hypothetical protein n=1 Tax=Pseudovibrio sp. POLY-S9 TaxID=1576596 RepID=UPI00070C395B|nr:hypothetical protein [Pseudovibrio sp. POLY-S9]